ncbi:MAG: polymer-forming cytoskeletal protein [Alkalibacterium sp.]|nr:polymer-forming cytoskeletal protein [Alkalibacterium sp.]
MKNNKRKKLKSLRIVTVMLVLLGMLVLAGSVSAGMHMRDRENRHTLEEGSALDGPGFFTGDVIRIDGSVDGVAFAAGEDIRVNGDINGSLFVAGQRIVISGEVNGNIFGAGETIEMNGQSEGEVFLAGETVSIAESAQIGRDAFTAAMRVIIDGAVPRHLFSAGETVRVNGSVGGNANLASESVILDDSTVIEGDLIYDSPNEAQIAPGANVAGQTDWRQTEPWNMGRTLSQQTRWLLIFFWVLFSVLSALVVWFIIKLISKDFWIDTVWPIADRPLKTVGTGLVSLIITPFIAGILMVTIVGIPMGIILFMLYAIALYVAKIIVGLFVGASLFRLFGRTEGNNEFLLVLIGVVILDLLMIIPILNLVTWLVIAVFGLGALFLSRREGHRHVERFEDY